MNPAMREHAASDDHVVNAQKSANISPFSFIRQSPCLPMTSSYPLFSDPMLSFKSPMSIVISFSFSLSHNVCSLMQKSSLFLHPCRFVVA